MKPTLVWAITALGLALALLGGVSTVARRRMGLAHWVVVGLLEAALLVQAGVAIAALAGGHRLSETATFYGYIAGVLVIPVIGALWAWTERTRWAGTELAVAGVAVAVMSWRLVQIWNGGA